MLVFTVNFRLDMFGNPQPRGKVGISTWAGRCNKSWLGEGQRETRISEPLLDFFGAEDFLGQSVPFRESGSFVGKMALVHCQA